MALGGGSQGGVVARWRKGEQTVQFLIDRGRLESFVAADLAALTGAQMARAVAAGPPVRVRGPGRAHSQRCHSVIIRSARNVAQSTALGRSQSRLS
jgi:hypothetical protein